MLSVCIATYNGEKYIQQKLVSILKQLGKDDEIIISDDSLTDKTKYFLINTKHCLCLYFLNQGLCYQQITSLVVSI